MQSFRRSHYKYLKQYSNMTIEITSCSKPGIWYEHRIGQRFEVVAKPGYKTHVKDNPLFTIHEQDYKEYKPQPVKELPQRSHRELITVYSNKQYA